MHTYKMCVYISFIIFTTIENRWYFQTHYIAHARNMPSDCVKNSIGTYRNALKHTMDCQLFVWKHSRSRSLSLSLSLSLFPDLKALTPQGIFSLKDPRSKGFALFPTLNFHASLAAGRFHFYDFTRGTSPVSFVCQGFLRNLMSCGFLSVDFTAIL